MGSRFGLNLFAVLAAGFLAVVSRTFGQTPLEWTAFGLSAAVVVAAVAGLVLAARGRGSAGYATLAVVGGWSLVAALVFTGSALSWLVFADALAVGVVALAGLTAHEVTTERVVHTLDVRQAQAV
jgi:hypothetical protein